MKHGRIEEVKAPPGPPDLVISDVARRLTDMLHGPYSGPATAEAAVLAAEAMRYLNYAVMRGGVADPAAAAAVVAELCTAVYRIPPLLELLGEWVAAEAEAGRIADAGGRQGRQLAEGVRVALGEACEHADALAKCLGGVHQLTASMRPPDPAAA